MGEQTLRYNYTSINNRLAMKYEKVMLFVEVQVRAVPGSNVAQEGRECWK
jgi:hypothetical protein